MDASDHRSAATSSAFDDFYAAHRAHAVRWAAALTGRRDVAEDLAQDALLRTGRRLDTLDNPGAYLRRAVVNACHSWQRSHLREARRIRLVSADDRDGSGDQAPLSGPTVEVLDLLATLGDTQRSAVVLRFWAEWSDAEIAAALDTTEGNVRVLVHRGLARLRAGLIGTSDTTTGARR